MRLIGRIGLGAALLSVLLLAGCGGDAPKISKIVFTSPAFSGDKLPAHYTCDGQNISPPLEWGSVPSGVGSLAVFLVSFAQGPEKSLEISVDWAVAGVSPALHRLSAGELPPGAYLAVNAHGEPQRYSVCPPRGTAVQYQFELYGLPGNARVSHNFEGLPVLDSLTTAHSAPRATAHGAFVAIYERH